MRDALGFDLPDAEVLAGVILALYDGILRPDQSTNLARFVFLDGRAHGFFLDWDEVAAVIARDIPAGSYVNLGIGQPTLVADHLSPEDGVILQTENGMLGMGPAAHGEERTIAGGCWRPSKA